MSAIPVVEVVDPLLATLELPFSAESSLENKLLTGLAQTFLPNYSNFSSEFSDYFADRNVVDDSDKDNFHLSSLLSQPTEVPPTSVPDRAEESVLVKRKNPPISTFKDQTADPTFLERELRSEPISLPALVPPVAKSPSISNSSKARKRKKNGLLPASKDQIKKAVELYEKDAKASQVDVIKHFEKEYKVLINPSTLSRAIEKSKLREPSKEQVLKVKERISLGEQPIDIAMEFKKAGFYIDPGSAKFRNHMPGKNKKSKSQ